MSQPNLTKAQKRAMKRSAAYWENRFALLKEKENNRAELTSDEIQNYYDQATKEINLQIESWIQRFAENSEINIMEARKLLNSNELEEFRWTVYEYIEKGRENAVNKKWMKELENASAKHHIDRLQALKLECQSVLENLAQKELNTTHDLYKNILTEGYQHAQYEMQKGTGIGWNLTRPNTNTVNNLLLKPWGMDNRTFSDRIWKNKELLISEIGKDLTQMALIGKPPQKVIVKIERRMKVSKASAKRLVMTETAYFGELSRQKCFEDLGVNEYQIVATLDSRTSEICQEMDGKHFPMSECRPGETAPPFHPHCRTTKAPYFDDEFTEHLTRSARDPDTGKTILVPINMTYKEWKAAYVDKTIPKRTIQKSQFLVSQNKK